MVIVSSDSWAMCSSLRAVLVATLALQSNAGSLGKLPMQREEVSTTKNELECGMRSLALEFARTIQPWRDAEDPVFREIHDALQLTQLCGKVPPPSSISKQVSLAEEEALITSCSTQEALCIFVSTNSSSPGDGSIEKPVDCLHKALHMSRSARQNKTHPGQIDKVTKIILREGIHGLHQRPLALNGEIDSNLQILAYPNEDAWISGGMALPGNLKWDRWDQNNKVWVANLADVLADAKDKVPTVPSLFTSDNQHRFIRARYPNGDPEIRQWGYNSPDRSLVAIPPEDVIEWHKPPPGPIPTFDYITLDKNDSTMDGYNLYASGHGGVCSEQWGPNADSYWCSNYSQGGWAEVDQECAMTGKMQLPIGVTWNATTEAGEHLSKLSDEAAKGGIIFAWHSQSWAMHMFQINGTGSDGSTQGINQFQFEKGGGKQGGRNWCRCDQCTYAGHWCGQHQTPPDNSDTRLIGGSWMLENVLSELDQPGEFWYNHSSQELFVYPNTTEGDAAWTRGLRFAMLEQIIELRNVSNVEIIGIGFRDSAATFMSDWSAPSGGDWSLHRGGAVFLENTTDIVIRNSTFRRLDSNAIFLSRRNRNVLISKNTFEWLAENAVATWGDTEKHDATKGDQPWNTMIYDNVMRELGIYEKQSSGVGQNKAALSDIRNNIMFNMPRAGINFNDMVGGGDRVTRNLLFNLCRESGDHGPINSWDRQAYLTKLRDGQTPSFDPLPRLIEGNFIFANYGASQGVDNDDGSSWFHIKKNVFFDASGFKMDYGGHDSVFEENLVLASGRKDCVGMGSFKEGHGDIIQNNRCAVHLETISSMEEEQRGDLADPRDPRIYHRLHDSPDSLGGLSNCKNNHALLQNNTYYTPHGNASFGCDEEEVSLVDLQEKYGIEMSSTSHKLPPVDTLIQWATEMLLGQNEAEA